MIICVILLIIYSSFSDSVVDCISYHDDSNMDWSMDTAYNISKIFSCRSTERRIMFLYLPYEYSNEYIVDCFWGGLFYLHRIHYSEPVV